MIADGLADAVTMLRSPAQCFQDQQIQGPLQQLDSVLVALFPGHVERLHPQAVECLHPCQNGTKRLAANPGPSRLLPMKRTLVIALVMLSCLSRGFTQDWAKQNLEKSPRHGEWVQIKHDTRTVQ